MYKIVEYDKKYEKEIVDLWTEICVNEHGKASWEEDLKQSHAETYNLFLVLLHNEKVVGTMAYKTKNEIETNTAEIKRVYLAKDHRGKGWAKIMFDMIIEDIEKNGFEKIFIGTNDQFSSGISFYKKNGFELVETSDNNHFFEKKINLK